MGNAIYDEVQPFVFGFDTIGSDATFVAALEPNEVVPIRVDTLLAISSSSIDQVALIKQSDVYGEYVILGTITIPAGAGYTTGPGIDLIQQLAVGAVGGLLVPPTRAIVILSTTSLESGATVSICMMGGTL